MAGFKTHITTSSLLGVCYAGGGVYMGLPLESSLIAGGLCGIGGMLPDIDSDSGVPFRESMGFAAAIVPVLMLDRFREFGLNFEQITLLCGGMYLFVRFGIARLLSRYTVHRGMFHSLPAAAIFTGLVFLLSSYGGLQLRYYKAAGMFLGVMSHLMLDEIYAVEWYRGRWRFKKSFGTAMKLWSKSTWANLSTYAKLTIVVLMILGEPMVMDRYGHRYEQLSGVIIQRDQWRQQETPTPADPHAIIPPAEGSVAYDGAYDGHVAPQTWQSADIQPPVDGNAPTARSNDLRHGRTDLAELARRLGAALKTSLVGLWAKDPPLYGQSEMKTKSTLPSNHTPPPRGHVN